MRLGARIFKTGLAVAIALYAAALIGFPSTVFAGFAAVFAMQPSIYQSFKTIVKQLQANLVGVCTATIISYIIGNDPVVVGFAVVIVISLCRFFKLEKSAVSIALIAVISVMERTDMEIYQFAFLRFSSLMLGIVSASLVNLLFLPPKYETTLFQYIEHITGEILQWLRVTIRHLSDDPSLKKEMKQINGEIRRMDELYSLFSEERVYFQKNRLLRARKLVVFRQLIKVTHKSFAVLKAIQSVDNRANLIPEQVRDKLVQEIDLAIHAHEHLLLGFMRRIKRSEQQHVHHLTDSNIPELVDSLLDMYQRNDTDYLTFLPLATTLITYHQELTHLQTLLNSYEQFHGEEKLEIIPSRKLE
ncbi:FUSC family protein [Amphibacillus sediminis]|uniref:FUSC family protein n=1 Tax=Amphibacillus sediminis TaxID=360185 RepID=UPI00082CA709|nr:aromatic acid exporter family protein [Amphibacillus sediminis]